MANGGVPSTARLSPRRVWPWKRISVILLVLLVICLATIAGLAITRTGSVTRTGIDWYRFTTNYQTYELDSGDLFPTPAECSTSTTFVCSDLWVAFNWSTHDGQPLTFEFESDQGYPQLVVLYTSTNLSFGGYSFYCGARAPCGDPFLITTNDTSSRAWTFQWETLFNYTATTSTPLL